MTEILMFIVVLASLAYTAYKEYSHSKQVKDLTTKLLAKNVGEYVALGKTEEDLLKTAAKEQDAVPIEETEIWEDKKKFIEAIKK